MNMERRNLVDPKDDVRDATNRNAGAPNIMALQDRIARLEQALSRMTKENADLKARVHTLERNA